MTAGSSSALSLSSASSIEAFPYQDNLSVIIPAYNEEGGIVATLNELRTRMPNVEVIVVDDGSKDATCSRALAVPGVRVIQHSFNRGYGAALKTGIRYASRPFLAWFDADNEHRVTDLADMLRRIVDEDLVAVIGRRRAAGPSVIRNWGKFAIRMLARTLGVDAGKDLNCGLRVFRREFVQGYSSILPDAYSASLTSTMMLIEGRYRFAFHDIQVNARIGQSKVRLAHGFSSLALVLRMVMLFAPMRIFFLPGVVLFLIGLVYGFEKAIITGQGIPVLGMLVMTTGLLSAMLGLVADQISQMRLVQLNEQSRFGSLELTVGEEAAPSASAAGNEPGA